MRGRADVVAAIVAKDLRLFARDRFYVLISVMTLVLFGALFWVLPSSVETRAPVGVHLPGAQELLEQGLAAAAAQGLGAPDEPGLGQAGAQGLEIVGYDSPRALEDAVAEGDEVLAGLSFPEGFLRDVTAGRPTTVRVLVAGQAPEALRPALEGAVREVAFAIAGEGLPVTLPALEEMVVGVDRSDAPLSLRDQLRPLLIFVVLLMEMFALAALVAVEIAQRTATAVLVTPARASDLLAAKTVLGTGLAFGQALLISLVTGTLTHAPGLILLALLLGAVLVTGFGLIAGSTGRDFIAIVFFSVLFFVPLAIPAFSVLFPGTPALWVRLLPTYGLVEVLVRTSGYGEGWGEAWPYLAVLAVWCLAAFGAGTAVLGWRVRRA
jgi:ABC-2 type transport system permease protein